MTRLDIWFQQGIQPEFVLRKITAWKKQQPKKPITNLKYFDGMLLEALGDMEKKAPQPKPPDPADKPGTPEYEAKMKELGFIV